MEVARRRDADRARKVVHLPLGPEGTEAGLATAIRPDAAEGDEDVAREVAGDRLGLPGHRIRDRASAAHAIEGGRRALELERIRARDRD